MIIKKTFNPRGFAVAMIIISVFSYCKSVKPGDPYCQYIVRSNPSIEVIEAVAYISCSYPDGRGGGQWISFEEMVTAFYDEFYYECKKARFVDEICKRLKATKKPKQDQNWTQFGVRRGAKKKPKF